MVKAYAANKKKAENLQIILQTIRILVIRNPYYIGKPDTAGYLYYIQLLIYLMINNRKWRENKGNNMKKP